MAKVKITGHASGTGVVTVTAPNTSTDRTITLPDATATIATTADVAARLPSITDGGNATAITINSAEQVGIGETNPQNTLQLGQTSVMGQDTNSSYIGVNFKSTGTNYISSKYSTQIHQDAALGKINFKVAPSGTADAAITYVTPMSIDNAGVTVTGNVAATTYTGLPTEIYAGKSASQSAAIYFTNFTAVADTASGMNNSTGVYTVQNAGNFVIYCTKGHDSATSGRDIVNLYINNVSVGEIVETHMAYTDMTGSMSKQLSAGDTIRFSMHPLYVTGSVIVEIRRII